MKKQEFLDGLRAALSTRVGAGTVTENVNYYEEYINAQVRMGKSEDEVVDSLGDPRLLARSIAEANKRAGVSGSQDEYNNDGYKSRNSQNGNYQQTYQNNETYRTNKFKMPVWLIIFIVIFAVLIIFSLIFSVLSFLAPLLIPVLLVIVLIRMIRRT